MQQLSGKQILNDVYWFITERPTLQGFCMVMMIVCFAMFLFGVNILAHRIIYDGPPWARFSLLALCVAVLVVVLSKVFGAILEVKTWR